MKPSSKQKEAIDCQDKYVGVVAPAGSGKTFVIIERLFKLIQSGLYKPQEILCITYARFSAIEMKNRLRETLGLKYRSPMYMGTIHSCFLRELLREKHWKALDYTKRPTFPEDWQIANLHSQIIRSNPDKFSNLLRSQKLRKKIKKHGIEGVRNAMDIKEYAFLAEEYRRHKEERNGIDYKDILDGFLKLVSRNDSIGNKLRAKWKVILIDECQDLCVTTFEIVKGLSLGGAEIFMVGDPNQRIYEFRGAVPNIFGEFKTGFKGAKFITLEDNFRSGSRIVKMGNIARHFRDYTDSKARPENGEGNILSTSVKDLSNRIKDLKPLAILSGTNVEFEKLIWDFIKGKVPFRVSKYDLLDQNRENREFMNSLKSVLFLNYESFIGTFGYHGNLQDTFRIGFLKNLDTISRGEIVDVPNELLGFDGGEYIRFLISAKRNLNLPISEILQRIFNNGQAFFPKGRDRMLRTFSSLINHVCDVECQSPEAALARLEEFIVLDKEEMKECPYYLGTIHSAKGLEWDNVGVYRYDYLDKGVMSEEKCLKYVAVTRAKKRLFLLN